MGWTFPTARLLRLAPVLFVCCFASSPPLLAANPSKQATKSLKNDTANALKVFKQSVKAQRKQLSASLAVVDLKIKQGNASATDVSLVFEALKTFQSALATSMEGSRTDLLSAFLDAKTILTDGGVTELPSGFRFGDGGIADHYRRDVLAAIDAVLRDAEERVLETAKLFRKKADVGMCVRLAPPKNLGENPGPGTSSFTSLQHTISILLSGRDLTAPNDGALYLWGNCSVSDTLTLSYVGSDASGSTTTPSTSGNSWEAIFFGMTSAYYTFKLNFTGQSGGGAYGGISVP